MNIVYLKQFVDQSEEKKKKKKKKINKDKYNDKKKNKIANYRSTSLKPQLILFIIIS